MVRNESRHDYSKQHRGLVQFRDCSSAEVSSKWRQDSDDLESKLDDH